VVEQPEHAIGIHCSVFDWIRIEQKKEHWPRVNDAQLLISKGPASRCDNQKEGCGSGQQSDPARVMEQTKMVTQSLVYRDKLQHLVYSCANLSHRYKCGLSAMRERRDWTAAISGLFGKSKPILSMTSAHYDNPSQPACGERRIRESLVTHLYHSTVAHFHLSLKCEPVPVERLKTWDDYLPYMECGSVGQPSTKPGREGAAGDVENLSYEAGQHAERQWF
jgi:hypothetical protein